MHSTGVDRRTFLKESLALAGAAASWYWGPGLAHGSMEKAAALPFASALDAARAIRRKEVSSVELTEYMLGRIRKHNPKINAIVVDLSESALEAARAADAALAKGQLRGPFHGVPITIKETYGIAGVATTAGAPELKDYKPIEDANVVQRMRHAGAVILGKTNVPYMAMDLQSYNELYGTTNNPWDVSRTPGGSTGGGAAALAAGLTFLSVGSDIGGSIRTPSHFCGVYGHKPTLNVISDRGHVPPPPDPVPYPPDDLSVAGPLARNAADLTAAMDVLGGTDGEMATAYRWTMPPARGARLKDYRVRYVIDDPMCPVVPEAKRVLQRAVDALRKAGVQMEEGWPEGIEPAKQVETYLFLLLATLPPQAGGVPAPAEAPEAPPGRVNLLRALAKAARENHREVQVAYRERGAAKRAWAEFFKTHDIFLMPVDFLPAFPHDHSGTVATRTLNTSLGPRPYLELLYWIGIPTMTGNPATAAPVGRTRGANLPVGIQVMGPYLEDATPIHFAGLMADVVGGFEAPPGFA